MRRARHYAFDVSQEIRLPPSCRWVRVTDFDPLGMLGFHPWAANPGVVAAPTWDDAIAPILSAATGAAPPANSGFSLDQNDNHQSAGVVIPRFEPPAMLLDGDVINVDNYLAQHGKFSTLALRGNIEVEYGEGEDFPGMVKGSGVVQSPFYFVSAQMNMAPCNFWLPKGTRDVSMIFIPPVAPVNTWGVFEIQVSSMFPFAGKLQQSGTPRKYTLWEPGARNAPASERGAVRATVMPHIFTFLADPVNDGPAFFFGVQVNIVAAGQPADDVAERNYTRLWAPAPGLHIETQSSNAANSAWAETEIYGLLTIEV